MHLDAGAWGSSGSEVEDFMCQNFFHQAGVPLLEHMVRTTES